MKKIVLSIVTVLLAQTASAVITVNSTWEEIFAAKGPYQIHAPVVYMGRAIDYTYVCKDGQNLRTMGPVDIVVNDSFGDGPTKFEVVRSEVLSTPINFVQTEDFCDSTYTRVLCTPMTYTGSYPLTVNISVGRKMNKGREVYMFTKSYTVPDCATVDVK